MSVWFKKIGYFVCRVPPAVFCGKIYTASAVSHTSRKVEFSLKRSVIFAKLLVSLGVFCHNITRRYNIHSFILLQNKIYYTYSPQNNLIEIPSQGKIIVLLWLQNLWASSRQGQLLSRSFIFRGTPPSKKYSSAFLYTSGQRMPIPGSFHNIPPSSPGW